MATTIGKGDRYRPGQPYTPLPYMGGFMPWAVPDQVAAKSPSAAPATVPTNWIDQSFASLPNYAFPTPAAVPDIPTATAYAPSPPVNPALAAATGASNPVTNVTGQMKPAQGGGLLNLLFGPSKNGMGGLLGLLGGPQAGGLLGLLTSPQESRPKVSSGPRPSPSQSYAAANSASREKAGQRIGHSGSGSSSGNLGGVSSSGRRYDYDNNTWV